MDAINLQGLWPNFAGAAVPPVIPPPATGGAYIKDWRKYFQGLKDEEKKEEDKKLFPVRTRASSGRSRIFARATGRADVVLDQRGRAAVLARLVAKPSLDLSVATRANLVRAALSGEYVFDLSAKGEASLYRPAVSEPDPEGALLVGLRENWL
jgi:hypothetical protein